MEAKSCSYSGGEEWAEKGLSPAARLFQSPRFNCYVIAIIGLKTRIDPEIIKQGLSQTLLKHPRFSSNLVVHRKLLFWNRKRWVRTTVDLNDHVLAPKLDSVPDEPDRFVEQYVSELTTKPLNLSKPLWELHLLNVKTSDSDSVAVFRIHHSVGDGASLMSLLLACTRQTAHPHALPTLPNPPPRPPPERRPALWLLMAVWSVMSLIWNTLVDVTVFVATILFLSDSETPIKGPTGVEGSTKRFVHRTIALGEIKLVKNAMGTTINDVLLGVTQAGLSKYLNRRCGEVEKNKGNNKKEENYLPKHIRLSSTILVNLRPTVGIQALADMMAKNSKAKWGNLLGYLLLPFDIALRDDPLDYVRRAKAIIDRKKHSFEAICTYFCCQLLLRVVGVEITAYVARRAISNTTMAFSNMIGPLEEVGFYGHQIAYLAPSVYGHPHALTIHFQSYVDKMTIVLAVDPQVIPNPEQLFEDLEESLKLIREAVAKQGLKEENV